MSAVLVLARTVRAGKRMAREVALPSDQVLIATPRTLAKLRGRAATHVWLDYPLADTTEGALELLATALPTLIHGCNHCRAIVVTALEALDAEVIA